MRIFTAAFAIASGVIVLLGYFFPIPVLDQLRLMLTDWAIILAGFAVLIGVYNLVAVHMEKIRMRQKGNLYGALLIISLILTFGFGLLLGPDDPLMQLAVNAVIFPAEAALMAILAITLVYASVRLLRRRTDMMTVIFLIVALLFLLAVMPTPFGPIPGDWLILDLAGMFSRAGARGLLIGVALGTLLTGLRVLFGIDRPYGGN
jgi:hypothetical protein